jgi:hypothetical protein
MSGGTMYTCNVSRKDETKTVNNKKEPDVDALRKLSVKRVLTVSKK